MKDVKNTTKSLFVRIDSDLYEQLQSLKLLTSSNLQVLVQDMLQEAVKNKFISLNKQKKDAATMTEKLNVMVEKMGELRGW
tara:strand:+ start:153 stop:395 length:243 start_codon:yes stop_codon:yes gene_type:complete